METLKQTPESQSKPRTQVSDAIIEIGLAAKSGVVINLPNGYSESRYYDVPTQDNPNKKSDVSVLFNKDGVPVIGPMRRI